MKKSLSFIYILFIMIIFASFGGAYATWIFAEEPAVSKQDSNSIILSEFVWAPEEILPDVTPGQNYLDLYESILNNNKGGLNSSKDTLENALFKDDEGLLHGDENVSGGNLKHLFVTSASRELDFIAQRISNTEIHVYMYQASQAKGGAVGVTKINVYMTIYLSDGEDWEGAEAQLGTAIVQYMPNSNIIAIDVGTWTKQS